MRPDIVIADQDGWAIPSDQKQGVILAQNGVFTFRRLMLGQLTLVDLIRRLGPGFAGPGMQSINGGFVFNAPCIARADLKQVESFFRAVYRQHQGEAIVFLYFTPAQGGKWRFTSIPQEVSSAHLKWKTPGPAPKGWYLAGSFHSHNVMSAFHSGTDNQDELNWDGIHVTIGKILNPTPEYAASVVIRGERFEVGIDELVEPTEEVDFPKNWMEQVSKYVPPAVEPRKKYEFLYSKGGRRHDEED